MCRRPYLGGESGGGLAPALVGPRLGSLLLLGGGGREMEGWGRVGGEGVTSTACSAGRAHGEGGVRVCRRAGGGHTWEGEAAWPQAHTCTHHSPGARRVTPPQPPQPPPST